MGNLKKTSAILILLIIVLAMSAANAAHALGVTATVTVGNLPGAVAYDSAKGEIFVANEGVISGTSMISVISDSDNAVVATIPVGEGPYGVAYSSGKGEIFVTNNYDNTTSVISDGNNTVVATIPVEAPFGVAYDSVKGEIFVTNTLFEPSLLNPTTNFISNTVSVLSDSPGTSASLTPATSVSPTPTAPEFSTETLILELSVMVAVSFSAVALAYKKSIRTISDSKQTKKLSLNLSEITNFRDEPAR